jgi:hypothetical protein
VDRFRLKVFFIGVGGHEYCVFYCVACVNILKRLKHSYAAFIILFIFVMLVAFFTFAAEGILLYLHIRQQGEVDLSCQFSA